MPKAFEIARDPAHVDAHVTTVRPAQLLEPLPERRNVSLSGRLAFREMDEHSNAADALALLRPRRERPCCCSAEQRDELAPLHSITSSAMASTPGGIVTPSV